MSCLSHLGPLRWLGWELLINIISRTNDSDSDCDDVDGMPRDVSGVDVLGLDGTDSDDENH